MADVIKKVQQPAFDTLLKKKTIDAEEAKKVIPEEETKQEFPTGEDSIFDAQPGAESAGFYKDNYRTSDPKLTGRSSGNMIQHNELNDSADASDMLELKMALGGKSDRSARFGATTPSHGEPQFFEGNGIIFSDEGSEDSLARDENENLAETIWNAAETTKKASLSFMH